MAAQLLKWMVAHQDFEVPPQSPPGRSCAAAATAVATVGSNINISNVSERHSESFVAVDYNDPGHLVASSNNITGSGRLKQFYSSNGGQSWNTTELPLDDGASFHSDPAVAWAPDGTAWAQRSASAALRSRCRYKSVDRGATWSFVATVSTGNNNDKELVWIYTHDTSPTRGTCTSREGCGGKRHAFRPLHRQRRYLVVGDDAILRLGHRGPSHVRPLW